MRLLHLETDVQYRCYLKRGTLEINKNRLMIGILIIFLFIIFKESFAQTQETPIVSEINKSQKEPPSEVIEKYENLKLKIKRLNEKTKSTEQLLKNSQDKLSKTILMVNKLKERIKDKTLKRDVKRKLRISLKDLEKEKTQLEPNFQLLEIKSEIELNKLRNDLSKSIKERKDLESKYSSFPAVSIEIADSNSKSYFLELKNFITNIYVPGGIISLMTAELFRGFSWGTGFFTAFATLYFIFFLKGRRKKS